MLSLAIATTIATSTVAFAKTEPYSTEPLVKTTISQRANSQANTATKDIAKTPSNVSHKAQETQNNIKGEAKDKSKEATRHSDKAEKTVAEKRADSKAHTEHKVENAKKESKSSAEQNKLPSKETRENSHTHVGHDH